MQIWFLIGDFAKEELKDYQRCVYDRKWLPPEGNDSKPVSLDCQIESEEEIGKLIRQPSKRRRAGA